MRALVCGPESSGTRILAELVGTLDGVEVVHRSVPHGWSYNAFEFTEPDKAIFITRDWMATALSQMDIGHAAKFTSAIDACRAATCVFMAWAATTSVPWWHVTYESLVSRPNVVYATLARFLEVPKLPDQQPIITDANAKWLGPIDENFGNYQQQFRKVSERGSESTARDDESRTAK